jgi:hypothetical protein
MRVDQLTGAVAADGGDAARHYDWPPPAMDLLVDFSQAFGLAAACGLVAAAPLAFAATGATIGWVDGIGVADDGWLLITAWVLAGVELAADALWPGAAAGARLLRRVVAGGLVFELVAGDEVPWAGLAIGAVIAAVVGLALRELRSRAVKGGADVRGTAVVEDAAGVGASALALIPIVGYLMAAAGVVLGLRVRRRSQQKYEGLRVLR